MSDEYYFEIESVNNILESLFYHIYSVAVLKLSLRNVKPSTVTSLSRLLTIFGSNFSSCQFSVISPMNPEIRYATELTHDLSSRHAISAYRAEVL
jgi:hypothetical protein